MEHVLNETLTGSSTRHNYRKFQFEKQIDFFIFLRCHGTGPVYGSNQFFVLEYH